jgi:phosphopantothenoylcysteine decarboxylase/phosphopantothenate--cysteine ligase
MNILITAGPTREFLDPFRFLSNPSSGKMGFSLAAAALRRGHRVALVTGPVSLPDLPGARMARVVSAREMLQAVQKEFPRADAVIMSAAVSDFFFLHYSKRKMKKKEETITLRMRKNPDILAILGGKKGDKILVGFSAETESIAGNAHSKLMSKNLDLILASDISAGKSGFAVDSIRLTAFARGGKVERWPLLSKTAAAEKIISLVEKIGRDRDPDFRVQTIVIGAGRNVAPTARKVISN